MDRCHRPDTPAWPCSPAGGWQQFGRETLCLNQSGPFQTAEGERFSQSAAEKVEIYVDAAQIRSFCFFLRGACHAHLLYAFISET